MSVRAVLQRVQSRSPTRVPDAFEQARYLDLNEKIWTVP